MKSITGDGTPGIRALNEEEAAWLNKFYGEYVNNSLKRDGSDLHQHSEETQDYIDNIRLRISDYRSHIKANKMEKEDWIEYNDLKDELREVDLYKNCSDRNNERNRCLYNETKKRGRLTKRSMKEMDQDTMSKLDGHDLELAVAVNSSLLWDD